MQGQTGESAKTLAVHAMTEEPIKGTRADIWFRALTAIWKEKWVPVFDKDGNHLRGENGEYIMRRVNDRTMDDIFDEEKE